MAFLGGLIPISERTFMVLLGLSLLAVALKLLLVDRLSNELYQPKQPSLGLSLAIGVALGLLAGMVGIGGGIFLSPILLILRWGAPKEIAATAAFFILVNSIAGLGGLFTKGFFPVEIIAQSLPFTAVLVGGQIGSRLAVGPRISQRRIIDVTAALVLIVAIRTLLHV